MRVRAQWVPARSRRVRVGASLCTAVVAMSVSCAGVYLPIGWVGAESDPGDVLARVETQGQAAGLSMVLDAAGNPVISYFANGELMLVHCDDAACADDEVPIAVDADGAPFFDHVTSSALDPAGNPVISYSISSGDLKLVHCDDAACVPPEVSQPIDGHGERPSLVLDADGNPVISYHDDNINGLELVHCDDLACIPPETRQLIDEGGSPSLVLDAAGNPVISYTAGGGGLRLVRCDDSSCVSPEIPQLIDDGLAAGIWPTLELDASGNPVMSPRPAKCGPRGRALR